MKIAYIGIDIMLPILEKLVLYGCEVVEIFTCKTDNFTEFNTGIISFAVEHEIRYTDERITVEDYQRLKQKGCEAVFCAGYYHKIPISDDIPTVNVHPSYLPYGKGSWPMPYYILDGKKSGGISIHKVTEDFDAGDILVQREFPLSSTDNLETYMQKAMNIIDDDIRKLACDFDKMYKNAKSQNIKGNYLKAPTKDMYTVDSRTNVDDADRIFRAFYGYECFYRDGNKEYILIKAKAIKNCTVSDDKYRCFSLDGGYAVCEKELVFIN